MDFRKEIEERRVKGIANPNGFQDMEATITSAEIAYAAYMDIVLPGWREDPNSANTPHRVAKMHVKEVFVGLYGNEPVITDFPNPNDYDGIVFQGNIEVKSLCSHHHCPFLGKAFIAYLPKKGGRVIGLSKLNRIVDFYARRPQIQEGLTKQIHDAVCKHIGENDGVAVLIKANHTCVCMRGVNQASEMQTCKLSGLFFTDEIGTRREFYSMVNNCLVK